MEIYKIMFFCQQVPQALCRIDERTLFTVIAIHIDLDLLQLATRTCFNDG